MASLVTNEGAYQLRNGGSITWTSSTIKARLCVAGTPGKDDTALTGHTAATGSTDLTIASPTVTKNTTDDRIIYDCNDFSWTSLGHTGDATHIAVYLDGASDAARVPIVYIDITDQSLTGATQADYAIPASGLFYLQQ